MKISLLHSRTVTGDPDIQGFILQEIRSGMQKIGKISSLHSSILQKNTVVFTISCSLALLFAFQILRALIPSTK